MNHHSKPPPCEKPNPAFRRAFARLGAAVAKATTPSELSEVEKINLLRFRLFGPCVLEMIAKERRAEANQTKDANNANLADQQ